MALSEAWCMFQLRLNVDFVGVCEESNTQGASHGKQTLHFRNQIRNEFDTRGNSRLITDQIENASEVERCRMRIAHYSRYTRENVGESFAQRGHLHRRVWKRNPSRPFELYPEPAGVTGRHRSADSGHEDAVLDALTCASDDRQLQRFLCRWGSDERHILYGTEQAGCLSAEQRKCFDFDR
jgi:hypothetical protein